MRPVLVILAGLVAGTSAADVRISDESAAALIYGPATPPADCKQDVECLLGRRYAKDDKAKSLALALFRATGDIAGVGPDEIMDGGYRGKIHLVPELPIGAYRTHLAWVTTAMTAIDAWFTQLYKGTTLAANYRWRALGFRFVRSVGKRTPSAYAGGWQVTYNVEGSLLTSEPGVRETLFHELFHLNDQEHGDWSAKALAVDYDAIVKKCGTAVGNDLGKQLRKQMTCLAPYAPNVTTVRGGTYYAFQPNNGNTVHEYAAELAVRYWKEQAEMLASASAKNPGRLGKPAFKCGPAENARAWKLLVDEFFDGRDLVPACPSP
ncbi:MAG: hypothetical protein NT062_01500 [Proteobacteria bacterium]|nr:hypothetical protein [Pseudomonadota bacterium]